MKATERPLAWGFTGAKGESRVQMARALESVEPNFCHLVDLRANEKHLGRDVYLRLLRESVFLPCPMGNVSLETLRMYEALENGSIPVVSRRNGLPYWEKVLGADHPLPAFTNWADARAWMLDLYARRDDLDHVQAEVTGWWRARKAGLRSELAAFVEAGMRGELRERLNADFAAKDTGALKLARLREHMRHHDAAAIKGRVMIVSRRLQQRLSARFGPPEKQSRTAGVD